MARKKRSGRKGGGVPSPGDPTAKRAARKHLQAPQPVETTEDGIPVIRGTPYRYGWRARRYDQQEAVVSPDGTLYMFVDEKPYDLIVDYTGTMYEDLFPAGEAQVFLRKFVPPTKLPGEE